MSDELAFDFTPRPMTPAEIDERQSGRVALMQSDPEVVADLPDDAGDTEASEVDLAIDLSDDDEPEAPEAIDPGQAAFSWDAEIEIKRSLSIARELYQHDEIIENAFHYYREAGFPLRFQPPHACKQIINELASMDDAALLQTTTGYAVADTYHPHRLDVQIAKRPTPRMAFADDVKFRHALKLCFEQTGKIADARLLSVLQLVRGAQAAANFRPGFALALYRRFAGRGARVLDTSTGFGGRLVGFMASDCMEYVGIDPATQTYQGNVRMWEQLGRHDEQDVTLLHAPAEDVDPDPWADHFDFAFTSPPYFSKEHYSEEPTQSWKRYATGEGWRVGFLLPMLYLQLVTLKTGAYSCVNIADVTIGNETFPLAQWTIDGALEVGFHYVGTERFPMPRGYGQGEKKEAFEPMIVLKKP